MVEAILTPWQVGPAGKLDRLPGQLIAVRRAIAVIGWPLVLNRLTALLHQRSCNAEQRGTAAVVTAHPAMVGKWLDAECILRA